MRSARLSHDLVLVVLVLPFITLAFPSPASAQLPPVPVPAQNPITEPKRVLGKILFWDEQLSMTGTVSCGTCHVPGLGGTDGRLAVNPGPDGVQPSPDDRRASPGVVRSDIGMDFVRDPVFQLRPQVTERAANSPINAAFAPNLFWDGRARGEFRDPVTNQVVIPVGGALESQSLNPPVSSVEMAHEGVDWATIIVKLGGARPLDLASNRPADVAGALSGNPDYPELFRRAFGDGAITPTRIAFALATYERTLIADQTPWDRFVAGDPTALTPQQAQGLQAFQASGCAQCHVTPLFSGNGFRNIGLRPVQEDRGLQETTGNIADRGKFKVPSLRNVGLKRSFMHTGQFQTLTDVIRFYARAPGAAPQFPDNQDPLMQQVQVPPQAGGLIQDFLTNGLTDPRVRNQTFPFDRPILTSERPERRATTLGGGTPGSGGVVARLVVDNPGLVGTLGFRAGVDGAVGGAGVHLALSHTPPVNGRITPERFVGHGVASGQGPGAGVGTVHWALVANRYHDGEVVFLQWVIDDAGAAGGVALSEVVRVPIFCGASGCPAPCAPDYNADGFVDGTDYDLFSADFEVGHVGADYNGDGFVDGIDYDGFMNDFDAGC